MRYLFILLLIAFAGLQYKLWFAEGSIRDWMRVKTKTQQQIISNKQLETKNDSISVDIKELKSANQALEEDARQRFGMIKNDETYFQIIKKKGKNNANSNSRR